MQADCTAMLTPGSCRRTHCVRCAHFVQTAAASQITKRADARRPRRCASRRPRNRPQRAAPAATTTSGGLRGEHHRWFSKGAPGQAEARLRGAEKVSRDTSGPGDRLCLANGRASWPGAACKARARGRARSAHRLLTRRGCLNEVSAANAVSSATGPRDRASQGSRCAAPTAEAKRRSLPGRAFAAPTQNRTADGELQQRAATRPSLA